MTSFTHSWMSTSAAGRRIQTFSAISTSSSAASGISPRKTALILWPRVIMQKWHPAMENLCCARRMTATRTSPIFCARCRGRCWTASNFRWDPSPSRKCDGLRNSFSWIPSPGKRTAPASASSVNGTSVSSWAITCPWNREISSMWTIKQS